MDIFANLPFDIQNAVVSFSDSMYLEFDIDRNNWSIYGKIAQNDPRKCPIQARNRRHISSLFYDPNNEMWTYYFKSAQIPDIFVENIAGHKIIPKRLELDVWCSPEIPGLTYGYQFTNGDRYRTDICTAYTCTRTGIKFDGTFHKTPFDLEIYDYNDDDGDIDDDFLQLPPWKLNTH